MSQKKCLIIGGAGALGKSVINEFRKNSIWKILNIDFKNNQNAHYNYQIQQSLKGEELKNIRNYSEQTFNPEKTCDCIINVAGGWNGGDLKDDNLINTLDQMINMNLYSTMLATYLAKHLLKNKKGENSTLILTGANAVYSDLNPGMIGYHLSKQAVHHLTELLVKKEEMKHSKIITILPTVIDTEANRKGMPDSDFSKWTKPEVIASKIRKWAEGQDKVEGAFYKF
jgi:dihydropteridine reductase